MNSLVAALSRRRVGMCLVKEQLYVRPKYVLPLNFLLYLYFTLYVVLTVMLATFSLLLVLNVPPQLYSS